MARQWNSARGMVGPVMDKGVIRGLLPPPRLAANVYETVDGDEFVVEIAVPGIEPGEIVVEATSDTLTVATEPRQSEAEAGRRYIRRERSWRPSSRIVEFPSEIDTDRVRATLEHGILRIYAPKAAVARRRVIRVGGQP